MSEDEKKDDVAAETPVEETPATDAPENTEAATEEAPAEAPAEETAPEATPEEAPADDASTEAETPAEPEADVLEEVLEADEEVVVEELPNRDIKPAMIVRVHEIIKDVSPKGEERRRTQIFEGMVLGIKGSGIGRTMTVRKVSKGFGVEKIYPLASPNIEKVEVVKRFKTRRAKLTFVRGIIKRGRVKRRHGRKLKEIKESK